MKYLAYGNNLNIEQMAARCPDASITGIGVIRDYELIFKGGLSGTYLTIRPKKGGAVPVAIWDISPMDSLALDQYECFPKLYYRRTLPVESQDAVGGFVYIMREDKPLGMPSEEYLQTCREGYEDFGFDEKLLMKAMRRTREEAVSQL